MPLEIAPIGYVRSTLKNRKNAPRQGTDGAPDAWLDIDSAFIECIDGLAPGIDIWILTWLHETKRDVMKVRPGGDPDTPLTGVFATRSPDRPNPIGLHCTKILAIENGLRIHVEALEAIDGTPVVDIKPVLHRNGDGGL